MRKQEFAARIWAKLVSLERRLVLIEEKDRVLVAVSGGPDSVCLAHYLLQRKRRKGLWLALAHINHGLRGAEAERDAEFVKELAREFKLPFYLKHVKVKAYAAKRKAGVEEAGRKLRYRALELLAGRLRCNKIATGHHMDDQAETVLLNLLRGTKLKALAGIPSRRPLAAGISVIRPLLALKREEILEYLRRHGLAYKTDASNRNLDFMRNWIRHKALPFLEKRQPRLREHLCGFAEQAGKCEVQV